MAESIFTSKRYILAFTWSIVNMNALTGFIVTFVASTYNQPNQGGDPDEEGRGDALNVSNRIITFVTAWTAVLSVMIGIAGAVVIGFVGLGGRYHSSCSRSLCSTTREIVLGSFMGALFVLSNLTLICAVLFGDVTVRDRPQEGGDMEGEGEVEQPSTLRISPTAFSALCYFLSMLYFTFSGLIFFYFRDLLQEQADEVRDEALRPSEPEVPMGYIGSQFVVPIVRPTSENSFVINRVPS